MRDKVINYSIAVEECLRYSSYEDQYHIVQYRTNFEIKVDFIIDLKDKLMNAKSTSMSKDEIDRIILDIRMYLTNQNEYESNQQYLECKALFRGYIIIDWFSSDFSTAKYREYNRVLV